MRYLGTCATLILAGGLWGGCVNVDTSGWQGVAREYKDAYAPGNPEKDRAVQAAREKAIEEGLAAKELSDYKVRAAWQEPFWWVDFYREDRKGKFWPDRFVVRVDDKARAVLFRDPASAPQH